MHVYCSSEQSRKLKFEKEGFKILLDKISDPQPGAAADFSLSYVLAIKEECVQSSGTLVLVFRGTPMCILKVLLLRKMVQTVGLTALSTLDIGWQSKTIALPFRVPEALLVAAPNRIQACLHW